MKQLVPLLALTLATACGDNIEPIEGDSEGLLILCDDSPACDDALEASLIEWLESGAERGGAYTYSSRFVSATGFRVETEIAIENGAPVARSAFGVRIDEASGALEPFEWMETGQQLGSHSEGARPVPISTLYEECVLDVFGVDRADNTVVLELFASGALKSCTFQPRDCAGDCTFGPSLSDLQVAPE